jgi:hypothetical protein
MPFFSVISKDSAGTSEEWTQISRTDLASHSTRWWILPEGMRILQEGSLEQLQKLPEKSFIVSVMSYRQSNLLAGKSTYSRI